VVLLVVVIGNVVAVKCLINELLRPARWRPAHAHLLLLLLLLLLLASACRQDFVAEAGASRKPAGPWELFVGT
jgi:hypothetical protein